MRLHSYFAFLAGRVLFFHGRTDKSLEVIVRKKVKTVLIVRLDGVGDLVMTSGYLKMFRHLYPDAWIVLVVKEDFVNLVELCPYVDEITGFDTRCSHFTRPVLLPWRAAILARRSLAPRGIDLAVNPRWGTDGYYAGFLTYFTGARWRVAYSEKVDLRKQYFNRGFDRLYTMLIDNNEPKHEVERGLDIIRFLGGNPGNGAPEVWLSEQDNFFAEALCRTAGRPWLVALAPGAGSPRRMWPLENFVHIGLWLAHHRDAGIIILGNTNEMKFGEIILSALGSHAINAVGWTTLRQAAAIVKRCGLFIGNDSGLLHIASAVGTRIVEISCHPLQGSDMDWHSPTRFGPRSDHKVIVQPNEPAAPCVDRCEAKEAHCIKLVSIEDVQRAIDLVSSFQLENTSIQTK